MESSRFSRIAHAEHLFHSPVSQAKADRVIDLLGLTPPSQVLDLGCGHAEMLIRTLERYQNTGVGIDYCPHALAGARQRASGRVPEGALALLQKDAADLTGQPAGYAAAFCIGATHIFGDLPGALRAISPLLVPDGLLLIGEGYWKRAPDPKYLEQLKTPAETFRSHAGNVEQATAEGLTYLYAAVSSEDDWDEYEGLYCHTMEEYLRRHPDDPDRIAMETRIRWWRGVYLRWGRDTLGFALYLFRK